MCKLRGKYGAIGVLDGAQAQDLGGRNIIDWPWTSTFLTAVESPFHMLWIQNEVALTVKA
jgi:hypothetical protein